MSNMGINGIIPGINPNDSVTVTFSGQIGETVAINQLTEVFISKYSFIPSAYIRYKDLMLTVPHTEQGERRNEGHVHDEGDLAKFYGEVFDTDITLVVNPNIELPKVFDNIEMNIGVNGPNSIKYATSFQEATDLNVLNNNEYRFRNRDWVGTVPRDVIGKVGLNGRMRDHYMEVKLIKDNKLNNNSTTSSNEEIKLLSLKTIFRPTY